MQTIIHVVADCLSIAIMGLSVCVRFIIITPEYEMPGLFQAQTQQQRMTQVLAPQLRQSLECLQVPAMELRTIIQRELEQNPALEERPMETTPLEVEPGGHEPDPEEAKEFELTEDFQALAQLDDEWRDYFRQNQVYQPYTQTDEERRQYFMDSLTEKETLEEHLRGQLIVAGLDDREKELAELLIGSLNDDGYLTSSLEELSERSGETVERLETVLRVIQDMHPVGVGARNLEECLLIQADRLGVDDELVERLIREELNPLSRKQYADMARRLDVPEAEVRRAARFIATLEPRPGRIFSGEDAQYIVPEVFVVQTDGNYQIVLDGDHLPHLRISRQYRRMLEDPSTPSDVKKYIREKIQAGAFLIKSIHQRQQTISNIANHILNVQRNFMENGVSHLRPLTMAEVARTQGIHETTVSRAIANKYIQTPQGVFEMKYFFTPGFKTAAGDAVSNKTIQDLIAQFVADEDPAKPLSDQSMVRMLKERGLTVARRTIAKYRDALEIPPSHLRKEM